MTEKTTKESVHVHDIHAGISYV